MSSNQSEELDKKWYVQSQSRTMFFQVWEKWYVQSKATEVCEFRAKIQRENAIKSEKHLENWIVIVLYISLSIRKIEGRWQINNEREKTERDG